MENGSKGSVAIITLIVGVLVGGGAGYAIANSMEDENSNNKTESSMQKDSEDGVTVGGAKMVQSKDIVDNAANAKNVSTLVSAVKAADLVETLKGPGPFTVFGPNNDAFAKLPAGTLDTLLKPENKQMLADILTYHVVPGTYTSADLKVMAQKGESLPASVSGGVLTPVLENNTLKIKDAKGNVVGIETADVISSNGVTHVIDMVLIAK